MPFTIVRKLVHPLRTSCQTKGALQGLKFLSHNFGKVELYFCQMSNINFHYYHSTGLREVHYSNVQISKINLTYVQNLKNLGLGHSGFQCRMILKIHGSIIVYQNIAIIMIVANKTQHDTSH